MAIDFNPQIQELGNRDWSGSSRGTGPDRTFEALFSGLAETAGNVATHVDAQNQENIRAEARQIFETTNTEFGFDPPPSGMQSELERVQALQNALDQGKISQVNYYGRLATLSKQLRSKYPGYDQIVDSTIQSVTGTRPANAYRDALIAEMQGLQEGASAAAKERRAYERQNEGIITQIYGEEYWQNPEGYDLAQVQSKVGLWKGEMEQIDAETKRLQYNAKLGEVNSEQAGKNADRMFSFMVQSGLSSVANGSGFQTVVDTFIASGGEGLDQFTLDYTTAESQIRNQLLTHGQKEYVQTGLMSAADLNKKVNDALAPLTMIRDSILGGNYDFASRMATVNNDFAERGLNDIYQRFPELRMGMGLSKLSPQAGAEWLTTAQPGGKSVFDRITSITADIAGNVSAGVAPGLTKDVLAAGDQKVSRGMIDMFFNVLGEDSSTREQVDNIAKEMFGGGADFMDPNVVSADDLETIYTRFLNPTVTSTIMTKASPEVRQQYVAWAMEKFQALPSIRSAAGNVNTLLGRWDPSEVIVSYDGTTNRIVAAINSSRSEFDAENQQIGAYDAVNGNIQTVIGTMNKALAVLDPIAQETGADMEGLVLDLMNTMNRQHEGGSQEGAFRFMHDSIMNSSYEDMGAEGMVELAAHVTEDSDLDFVVQTRLDRAAGQAGLTPSAYAGDTQTRQLLDMIGAAEGAGYNTLYANSQRRYGVTPTSMTLGEVQALQRRMGRQLGSSAFGKYQIMQDTLRDAMRAMKLSPNEVFTPELQDRIATDFLLPRRGYNRYRNGEMTAQAFLRNLAGEWASIPTSRGGKSAYHGDRMKNKATQGGRAVAALFSQQ